MAALPSFDAQGGQAVLRPAPLPAVAGLGLKPAHYADILAGGGQGLWFEVHPENYMGAGGPPHRYLETIRADHPLSMHGVGLSLGSAHGIDRAHAQRFKALIDRYQPALVSDHLSWSVAKGVYLPDLLPVPMTEEALSIVAANVSAAQDVLGRRLLIENPSLYLRPADGRLAEPQFMAELCRRTGCGWLLDLNNVYVSSVNLGFAAEDYLAAVDVTLVGEVHLAGHAVEHHPSGPLLIDDHGASVPESVWRLFESFLALAGPRPTLIERDTNIPPFADLTAEAAEANRRLDAAASARAGHVHVA